MVSPRRKPGGVGAVGSAKMTTIHPHAPLLARFSTRYDRDRLLGLQILRKDRGQISRTGRVVDRYFVKHADFPGVEFKVSKRNFRVEQEADTPFPDEVDAPAAAAPAAAAAANDTEYDQRTSTQNSAGLSAPPVGRGLSAADIAEPRAQGHTVEDDNEPDEDTVAAPPPPPGAGPPAGTRWITPSFCPRARDGHVKPNGKWHKYDGGMIREMDEFELFLLCFPVKYIKDTVIPETNKHLPTNKELTMQEFWRFTGCLFFMACHPGVPDRDLWWSAKDISPEEGAPFRLNAYMTRNRFKDIMGAMRYTNRAQPGYADKFHDVRQMQDEWNKHMAEEYSPAWFNTLDESMNICLNPYVPGWMVVPRKPHPFGNEYHSICDGDLETGNPIMWHVELQEGKDRPPEAGDKKWQERGKTAGLMLRMHEPIKRTGKASTMDSGFAVSAGVTGMKSALGLYGQSLVKKKGRYWPRGVPGDYIDAHFQDKEIGSCETLQTEFEGETMFIHCMKEEKYVTKLMSTFGTLDEVESHKTWRRTAAGEVRFNYPEPVSLHNKAKHWVDDHNQRRHHPIDLAAIWKTQWWPHRQFAFFLAITEVNAMNTRGRATGEQSDSVLLFRKKMAMRMLTATIDDEGRVVRHVHQARRTRTSVIEEEHDLIRRPKNTGQWLGNRWKKTKQEYQKSDCKGREGCKNRIRTYCKCNKAVPMCQSCHTIHIGGL
ncbi:hypothetical protein ACHAXT_001654 [Thalassiosira profunda]